MVGRIRVSFCGSVDAIGDVLACLFPVAGRPVVRQEFVCRMQMSRTIVAAVAPSRRRRRRRRDSGGSGGGSRGRWMLLATLPCLTAMGTVVFGGIVQTMQLVDVAVTSVVWLVFPAGSLIVGFLVDEEQLVVSRCHGVPSLVTSVALLLMTMMVTGVATLLQQRLLRLLLFFLLLLLLLLRLMERMMGSVVVVGGTAVAAADLAIRHR